MDIQVYIASGAIESYVLGLANEQEIAELEELRSQYPAVQDAIENFSLQLEKQALAEALTPPAHIKSRIMEALQKEPFKAVPVIPISASQNDHNLAADKFEISTKPWKLLAAASVILFIISGAFNFYFYNRYAEKKEAYQALLTERNSLAASNQVFQTSQQEWDQTSKMIADPAMRMVRMKSAPAKNNMDATLFWDSKTNDVYMIAKDLPKPRAGKQFQLWAIVNGKPVDAGIISSGCTGICKMKNIPHAQAFAITLEKEGGSPTPDMKELFVIGNI